MADIALPVLHPPKPAEGQLHFASLEGSEEISRLYEYSVLAAATDKIGFKFEELLGKPAHVEVPFDDGSSRAYHGLVTSVASEGLVGKTNSIRLSLRPWLWLLTRSANVRVFQQLNVPDILKKVFEPYGGTLDLQLRGTYRKRDYCVQYRESDFNFVSRLMEEEGIFYFFKHSADRHTLVLADKANIHEHLCGLKALPVRFLDGGAQGDEAVTQWRWSEQLQTGKVTLRDHRFQLPEKNFESHADTAKNVAHGKIEAYDYPAGLPPQGDDPAMLQGLFREAPEMAKLRLEEVEARFQLVQAEADSARVCTGARFDLTGHPAADQNREYVVLSTHVHIRRATSRSGVGADTEHQARFSAFKLATPFRPARVTPKPSVGGPQTATVVGPAGEEIHVDKYGRVKVQFHWDRDGKKDATSSCFVRVSQPAAGKGWGMVFLPRVGHEVVVQFLEGDPDQPLITGLVYNAENMPPYTLPDQKTVSTIKSRSSKSAGSSDFNELRFDDLKGSEYLLMQSQKDKLEFVKETAKSQIGKDQHLIVKNDRKEKVDGDFHLSVGKSLKQKVGAKHSLKVTEDMLLEAGGKHSLKVTGGITAQAGESYSIKAGSDLHIKAGAGAGLEAGANVHIKATANIVIDAGVTLTLLGAGGSVVISPSGVAITGTMVQINSGGSPGSGAAISPVAPTAPEAPEDPEVPKDPLTHH